MRVYVAGPMTGITAYNAPAFYAAAALLASQGAVAVTPFEANSRVWQRHFGRAFDPVNDKCDYGDPILKEMIAEDLAELCASDAIALLPGWEKSKGSRVELLCALNLRLTVLDANTGLQRAVTLADGPWAEWERPAPPTPSQWLDGCAPLSRGPDGVLGRYPQDSLENSYGEAKAPAPGTII